MSGPPPPPPTEPGPLPPMPPRLDAELLRTLDDEGLGQAVEQLAAVERATMSAMSPYDRQLRELRARMAEVATEQRRRERAQRHAARVAVREQARSGGMPTVSDALGAPESPVPAERPLAEVRAYLTSGGEVRFGFPTRPGTLSMTDGRRITQATTLGEARRLYLDGWEPGTPGLTGVRVHLVGTRIERVVAPDDVVIEPAEA